MALALPSAAFALLADGFDWTGRTGRGAALAVALIVGGLGAALILGPTRVEGWSRAHEAAAAIPLALLAVPAAGHAVRRLSDMGWRGAWAWFLLVPWAGLALLGLMLVLPSAQRRLHSVGPGRVVGQAAAGLLGFAIAASLLWSPLPITDEGMRPALLPGDLALVRRDASFERGDVLAFRLPGLPTDAPARAGRLIALEGETVSLDTGLPSIDGAAFLQSLDGYVTDTFGPQGPARTVQRCGNGAVGIGAPCTTRRLSETSPDGSTHAILDLGPSVRDVMAPVLVPAGFLFVLGDHRDVAFDSRTARAAGGTGLIPLDAVLGRVDRVLASSTAATPWDPRGWRLGRLMARVG